MPVSQTMDYATDGAWRFVRMVSSNGVVSVCVNGSKVLSLPAPAGRLATSYEPHLGKNADWAPYGAYFDGGIDDVRVLASALPCQ
jgi:concanavalin A-like lectin/glucanase superfamily protein